MVTIGVLWLPILLSTITVWVASAIIWTVMRHHKSDFRKLPDEDAALQALTPQRLVPGQRAAGRPGVRSSDRWLLRLALAGMRLT